MDNNLLKDPEQIRAVVLHVHRTGENYRLAHIHPDFAYLGLYPETYRPLDAKTNCPNCGHSKTFEIGYGNYQCDRCLFVHKPENKPEDGTDK